MYFTKGSVLASAQIPHVCGGYFSVMRQANFHLGQRQEHSDPSLLSLPECFFLQITALVTMRRIRPTIMPMMGMEG